MINTQLFRVVLICSLLLAMGVVQADPQQGETVYNKWCDGCHMDSPFAPGTIQLRSLRGDKLALLSKRKDLSAEYLRHIIRKGMNGMPLFRRTEISDQEMGALIKLLVQE